MTPEQSMASVGAKVTRYAPKAKRAADGNARADGGARKGTRQEEELRGSAPGGAQPFATLLPDQCDAGCDAPYVWKGLIAPGNLAVLFGDPGAGKSLLAPYIAYRVALGRECFGRRTTQGAVLYVPSEDALGMQRRISALQRRMGSAPVHVLPHGVTLDEAGADTVARVIATALHARAALIAFDTMNMSFDCLEENDAASMTRAVRMLRKIADETGAALLVVHHGAKKEGETPRGHGALNGAADITMRLQEKDGLHSVTLGKNRNGPKTAPGIAFRLDVETLGTDADGDEVKVPVLVEERGAKAPGPKLADGPQAVLDVLTEMLARGEGKPLPAAANAPADALAVHEDAWRDAYYRSTVAAGDTQEARRKAFKRATVTLTKQRFIGVHAGMVWRTRG